MPLNIFQKFCPIYITSGHKLSVINKDHIRVPELRTAGSLASHLFKRGFKDSAADLP